MERLDRLQTVLPVELPEDLLRHLAGYLDIDTRRALRLPPGRLTAERYAALRNLVAPVSYNLQWVVVCLGYVSPIVSLKERMYRYKRIRVFYTDGSFAEERVIDMETNKTNTPYHVVSSTEEPCYASQCFGLEFYKLSQAHSWYKRIPLEGYNFAMYLDPDGHWQFSLWEYRPADTVSHRVRLGPFLRGIDGVTRLEPVSMYEFDIIYTKAGEATFREWIEHHYPEYSHIKWNEGYSPVAVEDIFVNEYNGYWRQIKNIAAKYKP